MEFRSDPHVQATIPEEGKFLLGYITIVMQTCSVILMNVGTQCLGPGWDDMGDARGVGLEQLGTCWCLQQ